MRIVDVTPEHEDLYFVCLEDWSDEMTEAGDHKERWYRQMQDKGLIAKLALDAEGRVGAMIQAIPSEHAPIEGDGLYFVLCTWVHGYAQGRGDFRGQGMGTALLQAVEAEARARGARGMAAWGLILPFWMKASWYRKRGYRKCDRDGIAALVFKPFVDSTRPPRWIRQRKKPQAQPGKVTVTAFVTGWCPGRNIACERARRACEGLGDRVELREIGTTDRETFLEWGTQDDVFIDGKKVTMGPPPKFEKLRGAIEKRLRKIGR